MRLLAAAVLLALTAAGCSTSPPAAHPRRSAPPGTPSPARSSAPARTRARRPTVRTALAPWHTPAPVSRLTATAVAGGDLLLAGGLTAGTSTSRVYRLDPRTGRFRPRGDLAVPTHDAAALALRGHVLVLGGGSSSTTDLVQELGAGRPGRVAGRLPRPRSDAVAAQAGGTGYLVGGYDGAAPDARVLATRDGSTFHAVATLPVPVRYPAVAVTGGRLLVLGGLAVGGPRAGAPVDTIQRVDLRRHRAAVVGHLPRPLEGAVAVRLGGVVYLAGGRSSSSSSARASRTVFALDTGRDAVRRVGRLPLPVANAGIAALGHRAWVIGGESAGRTRSAVQTITQEAAATP